MNPILVRSLPYAQWKLYAGDPTALFEANKADIWIYGHLFGRDDIALAESIHGVQEWRYFGLLSVHPEAQHWDIRTYQRKLWDYFETHDLWLRHPHDAEYVRFPWFGQGRIYDWARMSPTHADAIAQIINDEAEDRRVFLDQSWPHPSGWMTLEEDDNEYWPAGNLLWLAGFQSVLSRIGMERCCLNGFMDWDKSQPPLGSVMYENADWPMHADKNLEARWLARPQNVLHYSSLPQYSDAKIAFWLANGGHAAFKEPETSNKAWNVRATQL